MLLAVFLYFFISLQLGLKARLLVAWKRVNWSASEDRCDRVDYAVPYHVGIDFFKDELLAVVEINKAGVALQLLEAYFHLARSPNLP